MRARIKEQRPLGKAWAERGLSGVNQSAVVRFWMISLLRERLAVSGTEIARGLISF
jgi:hypothetical protein